MSKITRCAPGACLLVITSHTRQPACQGGLSINRGSGARGQKLTHRNCLWKSSWKASWSGLWSFYYNDPCVRRINKSWQSLTNYWMLSAGSDHAGEFRVGWWLLKEVLWGVVKRNEECGEECHKKGWPNK